MNKNTEPMKKYHSLYNPVGLRNRQEPNKDMYTPSDSVSVPLKHLRVHAPATSALKNNMLLDQKHKQIQEDISTYTTPYPSEHNVRLVDLDSENKTQEDDTSLYYIHAPPIKHDTRLVVRPHPYVNKTHEEMQNIDNRVKMIDRVLDRFWSPGFGDFDDFDDYDKIDFSRLLKKR